MKIYLLTIYTNYGSESYAYSTLNEAHQARDQTIRPLLREKGYDDADIDDLLSDSFTQCDLPHGDIEILEIDPPSRTLVRIDWELDLEDGEDYDSKVQECALPTLMYLNRDELDDDEIANTLSDTFGWLIQGFTKL